jgi:small GTP-binding protein
MSGGAGGASSKPDGPRTYKVVFLGTSGVGKTSIINFFMYSQFSNEHETTLGIDYFTKRVTVGDSRLSLQIWDTAGQEQYQSLIPNYIRGAHVAIIVYDVSRPDSFEAAKVWYTRVIYERGDEAQCVFAGNKTDLEVRIEESVVKEFTDAHHIQHIRMSAKHGTGIVEMFESLVREVAQVAKPSVQERVVEIVTPDVVHEKKAGWRCC